MSGSDEHAPLTSSALSTRPYGSLESAPPMQLSQHTDLSAASFPPSGTARPSLSPAVDGSGAVTRSLSAEPGSLASSTEARGTSTNAPQGRHARERVRWIATFAKVAFELENKGSVARDHLASERTFLAWLRTSLALASIGIAITQLFRLPASTTSTSTPSASLVATSRRIEITAALEDLVLQFPQLAPLQLLLEAQQEDIAQVSAKIERSTKYRHLGKPIGGTFIFLALVFLLIGVRRYFSVQSALMRTPSKFPPSQRSIAFSSFCVGALVVAAFSVVLATS